MISETKIDDTFPASQFLIEGFSVPYRLDCIAKGEGFCSISERIYLLKKVIFDESFEGVFIEKNLRSKKWLLGYSYNSQWDNVTPHLRNISTALDKLSTGYGNVMLLLK